MVSCVKKKRRAARKNKKRRKKKLPRTGGARRLHRQWHVRYAGFAGCDAPRAVLFFWGVDDWSLMLDIMAGMDQKDSLLRVRCALRRLWQLAGFAGFASVADRPKCSASWSVWTRRTRTQLVGYTGDDAPRAEDSFLVVRPKMPGILAGMDQKDSYAVHPCRGAEADSHGLPVQRFASCSSTR